MQVFKDAMKGVSLMVSVIVSLLVLGCDEGAQMMKPAVNKMADNGKKQPTEPPTTVGEVKQEVPDETVKAEDAADTTPPTVAEVAYYRDWQLTKGLTATDTVRPGDTIYVKVVFSEPVVHVVSDTDDARPALSFVVNNQATQFQVAAHGASGEDFVSGDCKPLHGGTDDYICKITVPAEATTLALQAEAETADVAGNAVGGVSVHTAPFSIVVPVVEPLTIVSITHYRDDEMIPEGASVDEGTTITTEIVFSMPVRANSVVISYPVNFSTKQLYHSTGVHWRESYQISANGTTVRSKLIASEETFSLTIERAASLEGSVLKQAVTAPELQVVPRVEPIVSVPQEPTVADPHEPTTPVPQVSVIPDAVEQRAMRIAEKVAAARIRVAAKGSRERYMNFSEDWSAALDVIAAEEGVQELSSDLAKDLYSIYRKNTQYPMTDYMKANKRYAPSLVLAYFRLRFLNPRSTQEAVLGMFKADVRNGTIKVFLM